MSTRAKRLSLAAGLLAILIAIVVVRRGSAPSSPQAPAVAVPPARPAPRFAGDPRAPGTSAWVEGTVRDGRGQPVGQAVVAALGGTRPAPETRGPRLAAVARTGTKGTFLLGPLAPGTYQVDASAMGHLPAGRFLTIEEGSRTRGFDLVLDAGGETLSGRVLDASGGPVPGARVSGFAESLKATVVFQVLDREPPPPEGVASLAIADDQGAYQLTLARGRHSLLVEADGYVPGGASLEMTGPKTQDFHLIPATTIAGRVVRKGLGVPGARVRASSGSFTLEVEGDAQGAFVIGPLDPGGYQLQATAGPLAGRVAAPVLARVATRVDGVVIEVDRARSITGTVRRRGGEPIPDAAVDLHSRDSHASARTDARGRFRLEGLMAGVYGLSAGSAGLSGAERRVTVAEVDLDGVDLELDRAARVSGRVGDERDRPCAEVNVIVQVRGGDDEFRREVTRAQGGRFSFDGLPAGAATVRAEGGPCGKAQQDLGKLGPGEQREITLRLSTQGRYVRGTVRWKDGRPAAGIELDGGNIRADDDRSTATTGADGIYQLGPYPPGSLVMVTPRAPLANPGGGTRPARLDDGDAVGVDFILAPAGGELRGVVLGPDGRPLAGAVVRSDATRMVTGADGAFTFSGVPAGERDLFADYPGLPRGVVRRVTAGRHDLKIQLRRGAVLAGVVEGVSGRGPGFCSIEARQTGEDRQGGERVVCAEGAAFELTGLPPGTYELVATTIDGRAGVLPRLSLAEGQERRGLRVPLATALVVVGRIVDLESRRQLAGARVRLSTENKDLEAIADATGKFRVEGALRGLNISVEVETPGHLANHLQRRAPMAGETFDLGDVPLLTERKGPATGRAGIVLGTTDTGALVVNETIGDMPAARAGLRRGDLLISIDGHDLANVDLGTAVAMIRGPSGTPLTLDVRQPDAKPRRLRLVRG